MVALFPNTPISKKNTKGSEALNKNNLVCKALRLIKKNFNEIGLMCDVALDPYTTHGHDGILKDNHVDNDATIETLCKQGVILAESGVDIIAPSDMMDGRTGEIRKELDKNGFHKIPIFPYSVKYASSFYGPFRGAVSNSLDEGDRKTHQMSFKNSSEYLREIEQDINEGCDAVIIKPALSYLDIISKVKDRFSIPIIGYCVSGVYSMVKSASRENLIDEIDVTMEILFSIKRAGATSIITYNAIEIAKKLNKE